LSQGDVLLEKLLLGTVCDETLVLEVLKSNFFSETSILISFERPKMGSWLFIAQGASFPKYGLPFPEKNIFALGNACFSLYLEF
jgi:hypothetical protein